MIRHPLAPFIAAALWSNRHTGCLLNKLLSHRSRMQKNQLHPIARHTHARINCRPLFKVRKKVVYTLWEAGAARAKPEIVHQQITLLTPRPPVQTHAFQTECYLFYRVENGFRSCCTFHVVLNVFRLISLSRLLIFHKAPAAHVPFNECF
jgi:hypothetical protein